MLYPHYEVLVFVRGQRAWDTALYAINAKEARNAGRRAYMRDTRGDRPLGKPTVIVNLRRGPNDPSIR